MNKTNLKQWKDVQVILRRVDDPGKVQGERKDRKGKDKPKTAQDKKPCETRNEPGPSKSCSNTSRKRVRAKKSKHECPICGKDFFLKWDLKIHLHLH